MPLDFHLSVRWQIINRRQGVCLSSYPLEYMQVLDIGRVFQVEGEELKYTVEMSIHGHEQQPHLRAVLRKVSGN